MFCPKTRQKHLRKIEAKFRESLMVKDGDV